MDYSVPARHNNSVNNPPKILPIILIFSLIGTIGTTYFYIQYRSAQKRLSNPSEAVKAETKILVEKVGKHMILPKGEEPTVATISDKEKLSGQAFFAMAKNGDKVLIYNGAKKAILYDPNADRILEVAPINPSDQSAAPPSTSGSTLSTTASVSPTTLPTTAPLRLGLFNGTNVTGLTLSVEKDLKDKKLNFESVVRDNTKKKEYDKTLVIDMTGSKRQEAAQVAFLLGATVGTTPDEEKFPASSATGQPLEIAIIIGKDYLKITPSPTPLLFP